MLLLQLLEKKKELSSKVASLKEEARLAAGIKEEAHRLEQRCQQVQASNTALKKQLKTLQQGHNQAKGLTEQVTPALILLFAAGTACIAFSLYISHPHAHTTGDNILSIYHDGSDISSVYQNLLAH